MTYEEEIVKEQNANGMKAEEPVMAAYVAEAPKDTVSLDTLQYAQRICTPDEMKRMMADGFLANPIPVTEPTTPEDVLSELEDFHRGGYMSAEETAKWLDQLAS